MSVYDATLKMTGETITGGVGGYGYDGGRGGAGVTLGAGASMTATDGTITGGAGAGYGEGGVGGYGVVVHDAILKMTGETIIGGAGGNASYNGVGGDGVILENATLRITDDTISGGAGGAAGPRYGQGGMGVFLSQATLMVSGGAITGGEGGTGGAGVLLTEGASATVSGGTITGGEGFTAGAGVYLTEGASATVSGGTITGGEGASGHLRGLAGAGIFVWQEGSLTVSGGTITGGEGAPGHLGGLGGAGVFLTEGASATVSGGTITGGEGAPGRLGGTGGAGVYVGQEETLTVTAGTITGGEGGVGGTAGDGVRITGGVLNNGDVAHSAALISGLIGVSAFGSGVTTITNFATIQGTGGTSVALSNLSSRLIVEAGAMFIGAVDGGGGTLELAGGSGTITGLGANGTLSGATAMTFSGFGSYDFDAQGAWTLTGENTTASSLTNAGSLTVANSSTLTIQGEVDNSGVISLVATEATNDLIVGAAGVTLSGAGSVDLGADGFDAITGAPASATLTNVDDTITGSGRIGEAEMELVNEAAGNIVQTGSVALAIDTGGSTIANAGTIEATGPGGLTISSPVANSGVLEVAGGDLTLSGAVTGTGMGVINGGTLDAGGTFVQNVVFSGTSGELELADAVAYAGAVSGFSKKGKTSLDLRDIGFVSADEATFSKKQFGGVLTVTDGTNTARINLLGDYSKSTTFTASSDGEGGTIVVASGGGETSAPPHAFIAAMAGLGASVAIQTCGGPVASGREPMLVGPRIAIA